MRNAYVNGKEIGLADRCWPGRGGSARGAVPEIACFSQTGPSRIAPLHALGMLERSYFAREINIFGAPAAYRLRVPSMSARSASALLDGGLEEDSSTSFCLIWRP